MGLEQIKVLEEVGSLAELYEQVAKLQRTLRYLLNGNLDFQNITVGGIKAQNIDVDQLSAIAADIGEVTAGIIRGVEIYGSLIATSETGYPRTEMSTTDNYFKVWLNETTYIEIIDLGEEGFPQINFARGSQKFKLGHGIHEMPGVSYPGLLSNTPFTISATSNIPMLSRFDFIDWDNITNQFTGMTLQQEFNEIRASISSLENSISTLTGVINNKANKSVSTSSDGGHNHGITDGTVLMRYDGSPVTYYRYDGHTHTQN